MGRKNNIFLYFIFTVSMLPVERKNSFAQDFAILPVACGSELLSPENDKEDSSRAHS
jgi:hypothetical protein